MKISSMRQTLLPLGLLFLPVAMIYVGFEPIWPVRKEPIWPTVPLVSVPEGVAVDIRSSIPGLLHVFFAFFQSWVVVEIARFWLSCRGECGGREGLLGVYEIAIFIDWYRIWLPDWYTWALYRIGLLDALPSDEYQTLLIRSGTELPWFSISFWFLLVLSFGIRFQKLRHEQSKS